ncbi:MAG: hypothetical protein H7333_00775 [Bdellovibrionales bacterium]|nr:hypothetical protein [Oligoflexia bacterium]
MNPLKSLFSFLLFLAFFYAALALRFDLLIYPKSQGLEFYWPLYCTILVSGIGLGCAFHFLKIRAHSLPTFLGFGIAAAFLVFAGVAATEDELSENRFLQRTKPEYFGLLDDHCGVYAGRTLLKVLHAKFSQPQMGLLREFRINNTCRLKHFIYLSEQNPGVCSPGEDKIDCRVKWMGQFSNHGIWNHQTRKFFLAEVMKLWLSSKNEEALVNFVAKDQELEAARSGFLKQAGIEEELAEQFILFHQKDELENLKVTQKVFADAGPLLADVKSAPPPYLLKFKDMQSEVQMKLQKIPEVEKDIAQIEQRHQQSQPSRP